MMKFRSDVFCRFTALELNIHELPFWRPIQSQSFTSSNFSSYTKLHPKVMNERGQLTYSRYKTEEKVKELKLEVLKLDDDNAHKDSLTLPLAKMPFKCINWSEAL